MVSKNDPVRAHRASAGLAIKGAGFVAGNVEIDLFLVDPFVAVYAILFRIVPHGMVPPIEEWIGFRLIDRIAVVAAGIFLDQPACHIVDLAITF